MILDCISEAKMGHGEMSKASIPKKCACKQRTHSSGGKLFIRCSNSVHSGSNLICSRSQLYRTQIVFKSTSKKKLQNLYTDFRSATSPSPRLMAPQALAANQQMPSESLHHTAKYCIYIYYTYMHYIHNNTYIHIKHNIHNIHTIHNIYTYKHTKHTLHNSTVHYITLHYSTLHYITLH